VTGRGARLVLCAAGLAWGAAALATFAPRLPEGLAAACAPGLVARELLAGLTVMVLLAAPAFLADEPGRGAEEHAGLLCVLAAAPAAVALWASGGGAPADLLPALGLLGACDLAASSYLRSDPGGKRGIAYAAAAVALLAALPVAAYGIAEFAGGAWAEGAFRLSPLLAIRDPGRGWAGVGPAALLLVAAAAVLRFGALRAVAAGGTAVALVLLAAPVARAEGEGGPAVVVVGAPREGHAARLVTRLREKGLRVVEGGALPAPLPWTTEIVVLARPPRDEAESSAWRVVLRPFALSGGRVAGLDRKALGEVLGVPGEPGGFVYVDVGLGWGEALSWAISSGGTPSLTASRVVVAHPASGPDPGVNPALFRVPSAAPPATLPGRTFAFLTVLAMASVAVTLLALRQSHGQVRALASAGCLAGTGCGLLFLPGVLSDPFRIERFAVEERVEGAAGARLVEILRVERLRPGGTDPVVGTGGPMAWAEVRYSAESEPLWRPDGTVRLEARGRYAMVAGVSGVETPAPAGPFLVRAEPAGGAWASALEEWRRSPDSRVARAGCLLAACLRAPAHGHDPGPLVLLVPAGGPDAVVIHSR
jgi:hypothetical protein